MEKVNAPYLFVQYDGIDITADISKDLISLTYTDNVEGESDELEITVENADNRWLTGWYPGKGSVISAQIGRGDKIMNCGSFEIDEIEPSGPPDTLAIRALATGIKQAVRTKKSTAFENQTLAQIAGTIAERNGFTVLGEIENISLKRVTQSRETDLGFLFRISSEFGYLFSVRNKTLVFTKTITLESALSVLELDKSDLITYSIKDKTSFIFQAAVVKHHNPGLKELVVANSDPRIFDVTTSVFGQSVKPDKMNLNVRAENIQQAEQKANAALYRSNTKQQSGSFTVEGSPLMVAGNNFNLNGFGQISGKYNIGTSTHTITGSGGYSTSVQIKRVGFIDESTNSKTKKKTPGLAELVDNNEADE